MTDLIERLRLMVREYEPSMNASRWAVEDWETIRDAVCELERLQDAVISKRNSISKAVSLLRESKAEIDALRNELDLLGIKYRVSLTKFTILTLDVEAVAGDLEEQHHEAENAGGCVVCGGEWPCNVRAIAAGLRETLSPFSLDGAS
jgi:chromosome segregation ATPase